MHEIVIALRNILRHRQRSGAALVSIVFGAVALLLAGGFIEWLLWGMRESVIQGQLGHIQVVQDGYLEHGRAHPFGFLLPEDPALESQLAGHDGVSVVTPRLSLAGLVSHGDHTVPFLGEGVDPVRETEISVDFRIRQGGDLTGGSEAILGSGLAATLGVGPGDTVALLVNTVSGGFNAAEVRVSGIFVTANQATNDVALRIPIDVARTLLRVEGQHSWVLLLENTGMTDAVVSSLVSRIGTDDLRIVPWHAQADFYKKASQLFSRQVLVLQAVIGVIILLGISNTLTMNVMERTGEIGSQLAMGFRRVVILRQFFVEGLLLGLAGAGLGLILGATAAMALSRVGIPMPPAPGMEEGFVAEILITPSLVLATFFLVVGATALAGLYPAWRGSRLNIVDALRHNR